MPVVVLSSGGVGAGGAATQEVVQRAGVDRQVAARLRRVVAQVAIDRAGGGDAGGVAETVVQLVGAEGGVGAGGGGGVVGADDGLATAPVDDADHV